MNTRKLLSIGMLVLMVLALTIVPVSAKSTRIDVQAYEIRCSYDPGVEWLSDGIYHARHGFQAGFRIPQSPEDPIQEVISVESIVNVNANTKTHKGNAWGSFTSESFEGTWTGKLTEIMPDVWAIEGTTIGHGVSPEFEGWELRINWESVDPAPFAGTCDGANPVSVNYAQVTYLIPGQ